jgi:hypothetical protein
VSDALSDGTVEPDPGTEEERGSGVTEAGREEWDDDEPLSLGVISDSEPDEEWEVVPVEDDAELAGEEVVVAARQDELPQPFHSTRSDVAGPRGCWALNKHGEPCGAGRRSDSDFCNAHSGIGVSADPRAYQPLAREAKRRNAEIRASMRMVLGNTRPTSPRGHLKARAFADAERIAARAVNGALDDPRLALALIREVDPPAQVEVSLAMPQTMEEVERLSPMDLLALAAQLGMQPSPLPSPPFTR